MGIVVVKSRTIPINLIIEEKVKNIINEIFKIIPYFIIFYLFSLKKYFVVMLILSVSLIFVYIYAPVDNINKRIKSSERRFKLKITSIVIATLLCAVCFLIPN